MGVHAGVDIEYLIVLHQLQCQIYHSACHRHQQGCDEYLRALAQFTERIDGHQSGSQLHDDEFILVFYSRRTYQNHRDMGDECRAGIHKYSYEDRHHGKRDNIHREEIVLHHQRYQDREERDHRIEHRDAARFFEIVFAEEREV